MHDTNFTYYLFSIIITKRIYLHIQKNNVLYGKNDFTFTDRR